MENYYIDLGNLIREKRLKKCLNTQQLARILNVSIGFISNLENAKTDTFNIDLMFNLCKTLDISPLNFLPKSSVDIDFDDICKNSNFDQSPEANKELIVKNVTAISNSYIESIRNHSYSIEFINKFTNKIFSEINYIDNFKLK